MICNHNPDRITAYIYIYGVKQLYVKITLGFIFWVVYNDYSVVFVEFTKIKTSCIYHKVFEGCNYSKIIILFTRKT